MRVPVTGRRALLAIPALVLVVVAIDTCRLWLFADDFHFLDVAYRLPLGRTLLGAYGLRPWFRPLSRELYFKIAAFGGDSAPVVAHVLSVLCLIGCALCLYAIGRRLLSARAAGVAVAVFCTYDYVKFLAAWPSGFQDLLAMLLVLAGVLAALERRDRIALACAFLAPFAKEVAFAAYPLIALAGLADRSRPRARWLLALAGAALAALALHALARLTWPANMPPLPALPPVSVGGVLRDALLAFVPMHPVAGALAVVQCVLAAACVAVLARSATGTAEPLPASRGLVALLLACGVVSGVVPLFVSHALETIPVRAYQLAPAVPWAALAFGAAWSRLPARLGQPALVAFVALATLSVAMPKLDLGTPAAWQHVALDWREAVRASGVSRRLAGDLRALFPAPRPESLAIVFEQLPPNTFFQTEDGPAARVALRDPSVRSYGIRHLPDTIDPHRAAIVRFDYDSLHLVRVRPGPGSGLTDAMRALVAGQPALARVYAATEASPGPDFDTGYLETAAALLASGPDAFVAGLGRLGLADTTTADHGFLAPITARDPALAAAVGAMLRTPRSAAAHARLAEMLAARRVPLRAALEQRIAVTLAPDDWNGQYRLAALMLDLGGDAEAREVLGAIARAAPDPAMRERARADSARLRESPTHSPRGE